MYFIKSTDSFRSCAAKAGLKNEDLTLKTEGLLAVPLETQRELLRPEIAEVVKAYNTEEDKRRRIEQHAKSRGKTLRFRRQLGIIYLEGALPPRGRVYVVIVVPPPPQALSDGATAASSALSGGAQETGDHRFYEVVIQKSAGEDRAVTLQIGDVLQLDEDESMKAAGGGIALIVLNYDVIQENHDH
ncbi:hypothetical protein N656DRAFT_559959 [Canariomyces notabilis]|uniref:Uncharacterized protein n=1 Tax=Canariomyces notabilis TaxID=2074819 RepID=A0AAN6QBG3_9PEZI|nr:hypothetical protein N656DRAFT_559959 [Canariomyces arenarius]